MAAAGFVFRYLLSLVQSHLGSRDFTFFNQLLEHISKVTLLFIRDSKEVVRREVLRKSRPTVDESGLTQQYDVEILNPPDVALDIILIRSHVLFLGIAKELKMGESYSTRKPGLRKTVFGNQHAPD